MTEEQYLVLLAKVEQAREAALKAEHTANESLTQSRLVVRLINGNPDEDAPGVRARVARLEARMDHLPPDLTDQLKVAVKEIHDLKAEWSKLKERYTGAKWVLGILGLTNAATIAALWRFLTGG